MNPSPNNPFVNDLSSSSNSSGSLSVPNFELALSDPYNASSPINYNRLLVRTRPILEGCQVVVEHFPEFLTENFATIQWDSFLTIKGPIHSTMIREFYSNYEFTETNDIKFQLFNKKFTMTLKEFGDIMHVPSEGVKFFSHSPNLNCLPEFVSRGDIIRTFCQSPINHVSIQATGLQSYHLAPRYDFWLKVISENIFCKDGDIPTQVYASEAALLWCLNHKLPVNMAYFMAKRMNGLLHDDSLSLPYGALLTKIFRHAGTQALQIEDLTTLPINYECVRPFDEMLEDENTPAWSTTGSEESMEDAQFISLMSPIQRTLLHKQNRKTQRMLRKLLAKFTCGASTSRPFEYL